MTPISEHFDKVAPKYDYYKKKNAFYYQNLKRLLKKIIPPNSNVLEIGCGTGDLLVSLKPKKGYGIDISPEMIKVAQNKHKKRTNLTFSTKPISHFASKKIDYIFMSDVMEHLPTPQAILKEISQIMKPNTIFVNTMANPIWEPILMLAENLKMKMPEGDHTRHPSTKVIRMLRKSGLVVAKHNYSLLLPVKVPYLTKFMNTFVEPYLKKFSFIEYHVCKRKV